MVTALSAHQLIYHLFRIPLILKCHENDQFYLAPTTQWIFDFLGEQIYHFNLTVSYHLTLLCRSFSRCPKLVN